MNNVPGQPVQLQLGVVPCYALTVHKTQALSIKHVATLASCKQARLCFTVAYHTAPIQKLCSRWPQVVLGCLEGVFAQGQIYVLISFILSAAITRNANTGSVMDSSTEPTLQGFATSVLNASRKF